jgi:hypothetical protein
MTLGDPATARTAPALYQIRVKGLLDARWEPWFEPMTITPLASGDTLLTGPVVDQAALHGLLTRVRDLGPPLISVTRVDPDEPLGHTVQPHHQ